METGFVKPRYDQGGFAALPMRITNLLSCPQKPDAVVLFLLDGFGWRFFEKFQGEPFLKEVALHGQVEKLIAQFPSTTAAHITTLHTGMPVGEHGIFEWLYYEPTVDAVIAPLLFSFAGTSQRDTLKGAGVKPQRLFPNSTLYHTLKKQGVTSTIFQHREYTPSSYSDVIFAGAQALGYKTLPEALVNLGEALSKSTSPGYFVLYNEKIDSICHEYGPESVQTTVEIQVMLMTLQSILKQALHGNHKRILFLLTADHGQSETDPKLTIYLNQEPRFAGFEKYLRTNCQGGLIVPAGSARDFFLYIRPGMVEEAQAFLAARMEGQAEVRKVADLMAEGYFGPKLSSKFCARAGDLVILPYRNQSVWWYEKKKYEHKYRGHHGGLTTQEMEIPLLTWEM
jgi:hypothetical protein